MRKRFFVLAVVAAALAACSSAGVDPSIADGASATTGSGQSTVTQVQAGDGESDRMGPVSVGRTIYFDFDSFVVKPEYEPIVEGHARFLRSHPDRNVALEGNTDERGSREYNLALGQKRSEAVRRAMRLAGASDSQMEAVSFGEENPAAYGSTEEDYAQNRRVEIRYR